MGCCGADGGGNQQVTTTKEVPTWAQPYAQGLLQSGSAAINQPVDQFTGMRVAPMNQAQQAGLSMIEGRALSGSPDEMAARQQAMGTAQGGYLGANPWLSAPYTQQAIEQNAQSMGRGYATGTAAQLDSAASRARAMGGSGYQQAVGQNELNLGNSIGNMANQYQLGRTGMGVQDWQAERNNMMQSIPLALQGSQADYNNAQQLMNAGGTQRTYQQQMLDQIYSDFMTQQNAPFQQIDRAGNLLGMAIGNTGATTQTQTGGSPSWLQYGGAGLAGLAGYGLGGGFAP
jgi:hypothetical protein